MAGKEEWMAKWGKDWKRRANTFNKQTNEWVSWTVMRCFIDAIGKLLFCLLVSTGRSDLLYSSLPGSGQVSLFLLVDTSAGSEVYRLKDTSTNQATHLSLSVESWLTEVGKVLNCLMTNAVFSARQFEARTTAQEAAECDRRRDSPHAVSQWSDARWDHASCRWPPRPHNTPTVHMQCRNSIAQKHGHSVHTVRRLLMEADCVYRSQQGQIPRRSQVIYFFFIYFTNTVLTSIFSIRIYFYLTWLSFYILFPHHYVLPPSCCIQLKIVTAGCWKRSMSKQANQRISTQTLSSGAKSVSDTSELLARPHGIFKNMKL